MPNDPFVQLETAIAAVFESWNTRRAIAYRKYHGIPDDLGTAVSVVAMVYGNRDSRSGTGVLFTRDPSTGEKRMYGEFLLNAQGEDVVAGSTTPAEIRELADEMPEVYRALTETARLLEGHYRDVQDVEFTVEQGRLYILQTREAKRSARAAVKTAVDMAEEGHITRDEALLRVAPDQITQLLLPRFDELAKEKAVREGRLLAKGLGASPGAATGAVVFDADAAVRLSAGGAKVLLVRPRTSPEDVHGMVGSAGVLTGNGGVTSHAAVVARGMGKPCVVGAQSLKINSEEGFLACGDAVVAEGCQISIDGDSGEIFLGEVATVQPEASNEGEMATLLSWADARRRLGVWANADTPDDAALSRDFGAEGIGLCRTEHMFFDPERFSVVQGLILAAHASKGAPERDASRRKYATALGKLERLQTGTSRGSSARCPGGRW